MTESLWPIGLGWERELVGPFLQAIAPHTDIDIMDIKEKWGTLTLSVSGPAWACQLAEALEEASKHCCEDCGRWEGWAYGQGETTVITLGPVHGWWRTLCQDCRTAAKIR
jgi:hypothetical protein